MAAEFALTRKLRSARLWQAMLSKLHALSVLVWGPQTVVPTICADFRREVLASCGVTAVRESCVIRSSATPAEPLQRSGIDEPFATSMTQLPMDRFQTFSVLSCRRETPGVWGISAA